MFTNTDRISKTKHNLISVRELVENFFK